MVLTAEFRTRMKTYIDECLKKRGMSSPVLNQMIWGYEHRIDFTYGQRIGFILGIIFGDYIARYDRKIPQDDLLEIVEAVQMRIEDIKKSAGK